MNINKGIQHSAYSLVIYGPEGIGKSTLASKFPDPLFIDTEGSTKRLDVARTDKPNSWPTLISYVKEIKDKRLCKTLVIDSGDWAEKLCLENVCDTHHVQGIEDIGYGKGYVYAKENFAKFLDLLTDVMNSGINVVITCHASLRKFEEPDEMGAYDRYELKLSKQIAPLVKEWTDNLLFLNYKTIIVSLKDGKNKGKGGKRVIYTTHRPAWDAKNRYDLADELPLDIESLKPIIESNPDSLGATPQTAPVIEGKKVEVVPQSQSQVKQPEPQKKEKPKTTVLTFDGLEGIYKPLAELMKANNVTPDDIAHVVAERGYFPESMDIRAYPEDFIKGVLVGAWDQMYSMIKQEKESMMISNDDLQF